MGRKQFFVCILGLFLELVVSSTEKHGGLQISNWPTVQTRPQHPQSLNYHHSNGGFQEILSPQWQRNQILAQNQQHQNIPRTQLVNNVPHQYLQTLPPQVLQGQQIPQQPQNNFARHQHVLNTPQPYAELSPVLRPTERLQQQITPRPNVYNTPSSGWRTGQELNQRNSNFEKAFKPVSGQYYSEPYASYGNNYAYGYPQHQTLVPVIPNQGGRQGWLPQNQNQHVKTNPGHSQWSESGLNYSPIKDPQYIEDSYAPASEGDYVEDVNPILGQLQPEYQNANEQTVPSEQPVNPDPQIHKSYILVHENGFYEQVDNFNLEDAHNLPKHIRAIIEVEDNIDDMENENPIDHPFDEGISQIPEDNNWTSNNKDQSGTHQTYTNPAEMNAEAHNSFLNANLSDEEIDMIYFKPKYLMPIHSATTNITETDTKQSNTKLIENLATPNDSSNNKYFIPTQLTTDMNKIDPKNDKLLSSVPMVILELSTDTDHKRSDQTSTSRNSNVFSTDKVHSTTETKEYTGVTTDSNFLIPEYKTKTRSGHIRDTHTQKTPTTYEKNDDSSDKTTNNPGYEIYIFPNIAESNEATKAFDDAPTAHSNNLYTSTTHSSKYTQTNDASTISKGQSKKGAKGALDAISQLFHNVGAEQFPSEVEPENTKVKKNKCHKNKCGQNPGSYGEDYVVGEPKNPALFPPPSLYYGDEKSADDSDQKGEENAEPKEDSESDAITDIETLTLRKDLETDASKLKTVIGKPIVWFRPDGNFWDKVTQGENSYDFVSFYDVRCQPQLIEKHTTVHHFQNGTKVIEYVEKLWKSVNDLNPKEVVSKKVVKHAGD